jgi:hypothetical protein
VHEYVDLAEAADRRVDPGTGGLRIEQVDDLAVNAVVGQLQLGDRVVQALLVALAQRQVRALVGQHARHLGTKAARGAGDGDDSSAHAVETTTPAR